MKPAKMFLIGIAGLVAIILFEVYPQWLAFLFALVALTLVGWGIVVFPHFGTRFEMRLPELVGEISPEERARVEREARMQGAPLPFGEKRIIGFEVRTMVAPVISLVVALLLMTYASANAHGIRAQSDREVGQGMFIMYGAYVFGALMIVWASRWFNERIVLNNAAAQFLIPHGTERSVRYDFRDARGEYFGSTHVRTDKSWRPGEFDLVLYSPDNPERSFTASSLFFHRIRRIEE